MGTVRDISDRKQAKARVQYMALHDALTGLPNRVLLEGRLAQAIAQAWRDRKFVAVLMLDLDRFKNASDSLGHHLGDGLLQAVSISLQSCLRASDIVARLGGDEFVICISVASDGRDIKIVAEKLLASLSKPFLIEGRALRVGANIGISVYPADGENPDALMKIAGAAKHEAKRNGRGASCFFSPAFTEATRRRRKLERDLYQATANGDFSVQYQPIVTTGLGDVTGVEALLRWCHPEVGPICTSEFIPWLEELGLMSEVGEWVLCTACLQNVAWQKEGFPPVRMTVNVSAQLIGHSGYIDKSKQKSMSSTDPEQTVRLEDVK